jgi:hypothetical protein
MSAFSRSPNNQNPPLFLTQPVHWKYSSFCWCHCLILTNSYLFSCWCNLSFSVVYYSLSSRIVFVLALIFNVYIQLDADEYKHIYRTHTLIIV